MAHPHAPQPLGWKVLVKPFEAPERTEGGIFLPSQSQDAEEYLTSHGHIISMGELAYRERESGAKWKGHWPVIDDHVTYGKYAGQKIVVDGEKFLILNDDEITSILPNGCEVNNHV
jgi:chaperonin GroES|tara:strand:- start:8685 stop:9032 length:348 start_codon:yes stop_codon:yes gene_type:complete